MNGENAEGSAVSDEECGPAVQEWVDPVMANLAMGVVNQLRHKMGYVDADEAMFTGMLEDMLSYEAFRTDLSPEVVFGDMCARYGLRIGSDETATAIMKHLEIYPARRVYVPPT